MTSREAFIAHFKTIRPLWQFQDDGTGGFHNGHTEEAWIAWQAAIQHALDVAVKVCEEISEREHRDFKGLNPDAPPGKRGNSYVEGLSDGADLAADAIKEALK